MIGSGGGISAKLFFSSQRGTSFLPKTERMRMLFLGTISIGNTSEPEPTTDFQDTFVHFSGVEM